MPILAKLTYLSMLFILQLECKLKMKNIIRSTNCAINFTSKLKSVRFDVAWYAKHNGTTDVAISELLMKKDTFLIRIDRMLNVWFAHGGIH